MGWVVGLRYFEDKLSCVPSATLLMRRDRSFIGEELILLPFGPAGICLLSRTATVFQVTLSA